jgi:hypothetical protein
MDLVERYLAAVARNLPDAQKADVTAELRDVLMSKVEELEAGKGRALSREETEQLLLDFGHPLTVSGRYRKAQHLIGPEVFPFWWAAVKTALLIAATIYIVLAVLAGVSGLTTEVLDKASPSFLAVMVFTFGGVTLVCALIERFGKAAVLRRWRPRDLPPVQGRGRGRVDIGVEVAIGVVAIGWWLHLVHFPNALPGAGLRVDLAEVWEDWWWPILGYLVFELVANLTALVRPAWIRTKAALRMVRNLTGVAILLGVLRADHWLDVTGRFTPEMQAQVQENFDCGMRIGLVSAVMVFIGLTVWEAWRARQLLLALRSPERAAA